MFLSIGRLGATSCKVVSSTTYPKATTDKWKTIGAGVDSPYYDATCGCWMPGYRPLQDLTLFGITPKSGSDVYWVGKPWNVCVPQPTTPTCPVCKACPVCPTCPPPPKCPVCATPTTAVSTPAPSSATSTPAPTSAGSYGPTFGILLALAVVAGGGYYAYKKGAFGKGGKKK